MEGESGVHTLKAWSYEQAWGLGEKRKHVQLLWALPKEEGLQRELYLKIDSAHRDKELAEWLGTGSWRGLQGEGRRPGQVNEGRGTLKSCRMSCHHFRVVRLNKALRRSHPTGRWGWSKGELLIFSSTSHMIFCFLVKDRAQKFSQTWAEGIPMLRTQQDTAGLNYREVSVSFKGLPRSGQQKHQISGESTGHPHGMSSDVSLCINGWLSHGGQRRSTECAMAGGWRLRTNRQQLWDSERAQTALATPLTGLRWWEIITLQPGTHERICCIMI